MQGMFHERAEFLSPTQFVVVLIANVLDVIRRFHVLREFRQVLLHVVPEARQHIGGECTGTDARHFHAKPVFFQPVGVQKRQLRASDVALIASFRVFQRINFP